MTQPDSAPTAAEDVVARLKLPLPVGALTPLIEGLKIAYGGYQAMRFDGDWVDVVRRPMTPAEEAERWADEARQSVLE